MKDRTKEFLTKLHDLLIEYDAEFEAIESGTYDIYCSGIDIGVGRDVVSFNSRFLDVDDIKAKMNLESCPSQK